GSHDGTIRVWDLEAGKELKQLEGHQDTVYSLAVSPDGKSLLSGGEDHTVRLWDIETGKEVRRFEGHEDKVRAVAFSADGKQALSGGLFSDPSLRVWDVKTGAELSKYVIGGAAQRPDPASTYFGSGFGPKTGGLVARHFSYMDGISSVAFSPDGKLALAGCLDNKIHVFELATGQERLLEGHTQQVLGAVFTPDGKRILSASYDQTVRLWDVESGKEVCRFLGHTNWVWPVAVSPDGTLALSGSLDQ